MQHQQRETYDLSRFNYSTITGPLRDHPEPDRTMPILSTLNTQPTINSQLLSTINS